MAAARLTTCLLALLAAFVFCSAAYAQGGSYVFDGGTAGEQAQVTAALDASSFDWDLVEATVTIHIMREDVDPSAAQGEITLPAHLLHSGRFAWGIVQHEYAHQIDFFRLDDAARARLNRLLGGTRWCCAGDGAPHASYGMERFASTVAWTYWPSKDNVLRPSSKSDEAGGMPPRAFRRVLTDLLVPKIGRR